MIGDEDGFVGADAVNPVADAPGSCEFVYGGTYDETPSRNKETLETPANSVLSNRLAPTAEMQTTARGYWRAFEMLYTCAAATAGVTRSFSAELSQADCQEILTVLANKQNRYTGGGRRAKRCNRHAHRHGWTGDTYGDASIVFSPGGDYVIVEFLHKPVGYNGNCVATHG